MTNGQTRSQVVNNAIAAGLKVTGYSGKEKTVYVTGEQDIVVKEIRKNCLLGSDRIKLKKSKAN